MLLKNSFLSDPLSSWEPGLKSVNKDEDLNSLKAEKKFCLKFSDQKTVKNEYKYLHVLIYERRD